MDLRTSVSRRNMLKGAAATGAVLAAGSLLPEVARAGTKAADSITIEFWTNHDPLTEVPLFNKVIANFEAANPGIKIKLTNYPNANTSYDTTLISTRAVSGTLADVFYNRTFATADRANRGWTLPLNSLMQANHLDNKDFWPSEVAQMTWKGQQHSLPYDFSDFGMYYNKTMFDKKGIKYPPVDGSWTWEDVDRLGKEFAEFSGSKQTQWGVDLAALSWGWPTPGFVLAWGGKWLSADLHTFQVNSPATVEMFQNFQDMVYKSKSVIRSATIPAGFDPWVTGKEAMQVGGSWATLQYRGSIGKRFDWDVAPLPKGPAGRRPNSPAGGAWSIAASSKHPNEAFKFLVFLTSTASENLLISQPVRSVPGRATSAKVWVAAAKASKLPPIHVSVFPDSLPDAYAVPTFPFYNELATITTNYVTAIMSSKASVKDTLAKWETDANNAIKKYKF